MTLEIVRVPVLRDNYVWLVHEPDSGETMVVDPATSAEVLAEAKARGWKITQIWNTHWHPDHTGGNADIREATGCTISGPVDEADRIPTLDRKLAGGDRIALGAVTADVIDVRAHTNGHIAFHIADEKVAFVGDTLFAMGCGRLIEGTPEQMFAALEKLAALPGDTAIYCAHEYTQANGEFALTAEPDNAALRARMDEVIAMRARDEATVPTTIAQELATNPFMRAGSVEELAERRAAKDVF